jgi:hypothetical protein
VPQNQDGLKYGNKYHKSRSHQSPNAPNAPNWFPTCFGFLFDA